MPLRTKSNDIKIQTKKIQIQTKQIVFINNALFVNKWWFGFCHFDLISNILLLVNTSFAGNCIREWDVWRPIFRLLFSLFFINFAQVTEGVRSFYQLSLKLCFSLVLIRFSRCFPFRSEQM